MCPSCMQVCSSYEPCVLTLSRLQILVYLTDISAARLEPSKSLPRLFKTLKAIVVYFLTHIWKPMHHSHIPWWYWWNSGIHSSYHTVCGICTCKNITQMPSLNHKNKVGRGWLSSLAFFFSVVNKLNTHWRWIPWGTAVPSTQIRWCPECRL